MEKTGRKKGEKENTKKLNQSPKGNKCSAIPVALLCMNVNLSKRKQGSGTKKDEVQEVFRLSINPSGLRSERANLRPESRFEV